MTLLIKHLPLWFKILIATLCITLITSLAAGELARRFEYNYLTNNLTSQIQQTFNILSATTIDSLITEDIPLLETIMLQISSNYPDVEFFAIYNELHTVLVTWGTLPPEASLQHQVFQQPVSFGGETFGYMKIAVSTASLQQDITEHVNLIRLLIALILLCLALTISLLLHSSVLKPISNINNRLLQLSQFHHTGEQITLVSTNELDRLNESVDLIQEFTHKQTQREQQLQIAKEQAINANTTKSTFLATMSHEIRNPMHAILGALSLLNKSEMSAEQQHFIDTSLKSANILLGLLNNILDMSKIEAGKLQLEHRAFNLQEILQNVTSVLEPLAQKKEITLNHTCNTETPLWVLGDDNRLAQVLINLTNNAIKFTQQGQVDVMMEAIQQANHTQLCFTVKDNGIGISEHQLKHIFDDFVQSDSSFSREYGGSGLGLAISKQLITLMKGSITVTSQLNQGSEFIIKLKLENTAAPVTEQPMPQAPVVTKDTPAHLLLVEDNKANQFITKTILQRAGYTVDVANNGLVAIKACEKQRYELILMDLQMPEMDGFDATKGIRQASNINTNTPIIAMTANATTEDRENTLAVGMNDFLMKPAREDQLIKKVRHWLN
ncbi:response regulator [Moritella sp. 36]|uniref:response regulator n=1 Tax=Moritella sp. 36 TaxID=2746233 RepID=UPI001BA96AF1|nr:response regulator [Moritella sp. 36]QUM88541.1 response regulator [Moritella sp. 36]